MRFTLSLFVTLVLAGCTAGTYTPIVYYTARPQVDLDTYERVDVSVGVREFDFVRPKPRVMAYRLPDRSLHLYPYAEWSESPNALLTRKVIDLFRRTGRFEDVGLATVIAPPQWMVTGTVTAFEEVREDGDAQAVCELSLTVRDREFDTLIWSGNLVGKAQCTAGDPASVAQAMEMAIQQVLAEAASTVASQEPPQSADGN